MSRGRSKKELERVLLADRLAAFGALTAGVLHDLNNPLTYVVANIEYASEEITKALEHCKSRTMASGPGSETASLLGPVQEAVTALDEAQQGVERVRAMLRELRELCRPVEDEVQAADLARTVEWSVRMAKHQIRHRARIECALTETPPVAASAARLGHVFLDLLVNAAEAIPEGDTEHDVIHVRSFLDAEGRAVVEIQDQGCGIAEADRARIFDPFFTTKPDGVGTGLGLAACQEIVRRCGGTIQVDSEVGRGSTFRVTLPTTPKLGM